MKKAFDQTVRDLKREVNKKVLKVPSIEQKVLDSTSNEPWGPHGSHLADIAQATRNYHEFQMIMTVIWKRINDTGKNWRHVYKALTVLEYLVANGSERVTDEIKEHAYQISTLSSFQYIDSGGRDQGSNVRRKSASLVELVNDNERIGELRQKAASNKDKFRSQAPAGGMHKLGSYGDRYDDERRESRYGTRDDAWTYRNPDPYGNEPERLSRDSDERGDERTGRRHSISDRHSGSRSRSSDRDRPDDPDGQYPPRPLSRKYSEQNLAAPPSYEEAVGGRSPGQARNNDDAAGTAVDPPPISVQSLSSTDHDVPLVDQFDPRGGPPPPSDGTEFDLLGALSEPVASNALVTVPPTEPAPFAGGGFDGDPFGDSPFKAVPVPSSAAKGSAVPAVVQPFDLGGLSLTAPDPNSYTDVLAGILPPPLSPPPPPPQPVLSGGGFYPASEGHFHPVVLYGGLLTAHSSGGPTAVSAAHGGAPAAHPVSQASEHVAAPPPPPSRFEPRSAVWADTLSRGLVNLNISGPKMNPLSDIGVDFEAMNRRERRMEKPVPAVPSMGRAMGAGSGIGRAGASILTGPPGPMMGSNGLHPPGVGIVYPGQHYQQMQQQQQMMMMPGYNNQAMGGGYMPMPPPNPNQQHPYGGYR